MKELWDLKDLTIHDVQPRRDDYLIWKLSGGVEGCEGCWPHLCEHWLRSPETTSTVSPLEDKAAYAGGACMMAYGLVSFDMIFFPRVGERLCLSYLSQCVG